jgi:hypothetical protein
MNIRQADQAAPGETPSASATVRSRINRQTTRSLFGVHAGHQHSRGSSGAAAATGQREKNVIESPLSSACGEETLAS